MYLHIPDAFTSLEEVENSFFPTFLEGSAVHCPNQVQAEVLLLIREAFKFTAIKNYHTEISEEYLSWALLWRTSPCLQQQALHSWLFFEGVLDNCSAFTSFVKVTSAMWFGFSFVLLQNWQQIGHFPLNAGSHEWAHGCCQAATGHGLWHQCPDRDQQKYSTDSGLLPRENWSGQPAAW